ncbi:hypothetical protein LAV73_09410 [Lysinibacillus xylanilyticus]|uniref:hypothetical protein n=1 Tax=Lysinibacillus xylanilyticus TaxID=582475 RepID=UPI002B24A147|nr:hypothetical protein [Lysinibacillus xylanilyticus]MEB2280211.1 hypothetical protein [Lysinibacillus xylanilyticus]
MSLINIAWGLLILLFFAVGLNFIFNIRVDNDKYKFYDTLIGLDMIVVGIMVIVDFIIKTNI